MKKKIMKQLLLIGTAAIILTTTMMMFVYYSIFQRQVFDDLKTNAELLSYMVSHGITKAEEGTLRERQLRVTVIDATGKVAYDNNVDISKLENHSQRPEVKEALKKGEGATVRHSDTLDKNTYYYAIKVGDDSVLRVAKVAGGLAAFFFSAFPFVIAGTLFLIILCVIISKMTTRRIIKPIEDMSYYLNHFGGYHEHIAYEELIPFAKTIWEQHESIRKQLVELERAQKMRQEFTANVSHELKTPLTSISGYAQLIESGITKKEDLPHFGHEIQKASTRLLHLINDIIQLSELDTEEIPVQKDAVDLFAVACGTVNGLKINAKRHEVELSILGQSCLVHANEGMMDEMIMNLCDNAIRYNKTGGYVKVSVVPDGTDAVLTVEDNGIGIPKEHIDRIFERFYRVDKSRSKETGGTGLGLAIVKHIAAKNDAIISVKSELNVGTTITVRMKLL